MRTEEIAAAVVFLLEAGPRMAGQVVSPHSGATIRWRPPLAYLCSAQAGAVVGQLLTVGTGGALRP